MEEFRDKIMGLRLSSIPSVLNSHFERGVYGISFKARPDVFLTMYSLIVAL